MIFGLGNIYLKEETLTLEEAVKMFYEVEEQDLLFNDLELNTLGIDNSDYEMSKSDTKQNQNIKVKVTTY